MKNPIAPVRSAGHFWPVVLAGALMLSWALGARAQSAEGISVQGAGVAKGRPTQVELSGTISAEAELAADATVKYRDAKKRAVSTMEGLRNPGLSLDFAGFSINSTVDANTQLMIQRGQIAAAPKGKIQVAERCRILLKDIDKVPPESLMDTLLKILDTAKDAGFQFGSTASNNYYEQQARNAFGNALVTFKIADGTPLRDVAYKSAIEDARAKAQKLADLAGVKLGRVLGIQEQAGRGQPSTGSPDFDYALAALAGRGGPDERAIFGSVFGDMAVRATLTVQFEIMK